jgi:23S rRNA (pseudouridine1915-N3)-methyltransferase
MLDIKIVSIGKVKEEYFNNAIQEYLKRLKPYARIEFLELKAESFNESNKEVIREVESKKIIKTLEKYHQNEVFLLHETGKALNSLEFSKFIDQNQKIILVIGGSLGFSEELLSKYQQISLSKLTFLHEMVKVILLEQIYRAVTILKSKNYHH